MNEDFLDEVGKDPRKTSNNSNNSSKEPQNQHDEQPPKKDNKKKWYIGCGCVTVILLGIAAFVWWAIAFNLEEEARDIRLKYLRQDVERLSTFISDDNMYSNLAKMCIDSSIYLENGEKIDKSGIKYFTRRNDDKLLVILKVDNLKKVEPSSRRAFVDALRECFSYVEEETGVEKYYISIKGFWNTLMVATPNGSDLDGKFADDKYLLPFYNEYVKDSLPDLGD
ncbi:hypothetical protein EZY14_000665 [Kordia sp. TARA_039_SRF]|nr:hypothetical protein EZY14_000665 [Kordia sp. TARA_039_SRF]